MSSGAHARRDTPPAARGDELPHLEEPTIGKLVADVSRDMSTLVSKEIELAKSELRISAKAGGAGIGLILAALYVFTIAFVVLSIAAAYLINWNGEGLALHWAYLIVFGVWMLLTVVLGLLGVRSLKKVRAPERSMAQAHETLEMFKRD